MSTTCCVEGAMAIVNDQTVADEVFQLATDDEGVDTAIVSFFDVNYVRSADRGEYGDEAMERASARRRGRQPFLKR